MKKANAKKELKIKKLYPTLILIVLAIAVGVFLQLPQSPAGSQSPNQTPSENQSLQDQNEAGLIFLVTPLRDSFYTGGRIVTFTSIVSNQTQNYKLTGEWFAYDNLLNETAAIPASNYNETFFLQKNQLVAQYRWSSISGRNISEATLMAKVTDDSGNSYERNESVKLTSNDELLPYLAENQNIKINDTVTIFALSSLEKKTATDFVQSGILLNLTRVYLSHPANESETKYFEESDIDSLKVFDGKIGTSSEYSSFYSMLLRSIGIPAKVMKCQKEGKPYLYTEVFISERGWIAADVYNSSQELGLGVKDCLNKTEAY